MRIERANGCGFTQTVHRRSADAEMIVVGDGRGGYLPLVHAELVIPGMQVTEIAALVLNDVLTPDGVIRTKIH